VEHHPIFALGIGMPHGFEWIVILVAMLLIFGKRLPEIMRGLGGSVKEFKKGMDEGPKVETPPAVTPPSTVSRDWIPPNLAPPGSAPSTPPASNAPAPSTSPPSEPK
jgi:sec-independent protein translocase protein TatA